MAFTVETGAGISGANSYLAVADADTYHTDRGNSAWTGTDAVKQAALIKATAYLDAHYTWSTGVKYDDDNGLAWPRSGAIDKHGYSIDGDVIPQAVLDATAELALIVIGGTELAAALERPLKKVKAGAVETEWEPASEASVAPQYPLIDGMLAGLVSSSSSVEVFLV